MAKAPELVRSSDGDLRVDASFSTGRYTFSLRSGASDLFQTLAIVGDVWLPNTSGDFVDDLAAPRSPAWLDADEARAVADRHTLATCGRSGRGRSAD